MGTRLEFHDLLKSICDHVYFQPPASIHLEYPCIIYQRRNIDQQYADNIPYTQTKRYDVTVISKNPDDEIVDEVSKIPSAVYDRFFTSDNLNHDVFNIYY